jgi:hypothetical protein
MYQCIVFQFLRILIYLYEYILNSYFQLLAASFFDIRGYAAIGITYQFLRRITNLYDYLLNS